MNRTRWIEFITKTLLVVVLGSVGVFTAVRLAVARDGTPGAARTFATVAGNIVGLPGDPRQVAMTFSFHRPSDGGIAQLCSPRVDAVQIAPGGTFTAQVPLDLPELAMRCPDDMLDGRDVEVDVDVGAFPVVRNAKINPVPYAHFATSAGRLTSGPTVLATTLNATVDVPAGDAQVVTVPRFSLRLPATGTYLIALNASCYASTSSTDRHDDLHYLSLTARGRVIASRPIPGRGDESGSQRSSNVTVLTTWSALAGDEIGVQLDLQQRHNAIQLSGTGSTAHYAAQLIAMPVQTSP